MRLPDDIVERFGPELLGERRARLSGKEVGHGADVSGFPLADVRAHAIEWPQ
jgi:hypothetical protein